MAERVKYEQWLADLEAKKDSTPVSVFDRVRQDYLTRLQTVMEQLREHTGALQEHAGNLMARLRELEATEHKMEEEQAEQELRAQVGEITTAERDAAARKAERALNKIKEDHGLVADDLNGIRELLEGDSEGESSEDGSRSGAGASVAADAPRRSTDFDELAFLKSVVGSNTPQSSTPPNAPKADRPVSAGAQKTEAKTQSPAATRTSAATSAATSPPKPAAKDTPSKGQAAEGPLAIRPSGAVEQPKTLKCAECGAMNYASEWYCERCGAELAVV